MSINYEELAKQLEASGDYKILRNLPAFETRPKQHEKSRIGCLVDCETSGWDAETEKIIEIGLILFEYMPQTGEILGIVDEYNEYEDPRKKLDVNISIYTGITDDMVKSKRFDDAKVLAMLEQVDIVVAHNASFDRKFCEKRWSEFSALPWACTMTQVSWSDERIASKALSFLLMSYGYFYLAHRAINDCRATLVLLSQRTPASDRNVWKVILGEARKKTAIVWAIGAPFEMKDTLKMREYRWNSGDDGKPKAWHKTMSEDLLQEELDWLNKDVYGTRSLAKITYISSVDRFSIRA